MTDSTTQVEADRLLITMPEAAAILSVSERTIRRWVFEHRIPVVPLPSPRLIRFDPAVLKRWLSDGCPKRQRGHFRNRKRVVL